MINLQTLSLFDDMTPHGYCLLWDPVLIWSHVLADVGIAAAYLSIPAALAIIARRRPDLNPNGILYFFAAFIILCAITHLFGLVTLWVPAYSAEAVSKVMTAIVSVATAVLVWQMLSTILTVPTHAALREANEKLARANAELESRVEARTRQLRCANERLEVVASDAREAERVKTQFLARVSHELRTPLNAVLGFTDLLDLQISGPVNDTQKDYLDSIRTASNQLLQQINDILDLERLIQHGPSFTPEPVAVDRTIADICQMLSTTARDMGIDLLTQVQSASSLCTDERALRMVLTNLMSNAIKYSRRGGTVEVIARAVDDGVEIAIRDQGVGIPADKLADVFEPFFRGHEHDLPSIGGTGLGLTLVKQLVDALGGNIVLDSTLGQGTTVQLTLPEMAPYPQTAA
ncbi:MULTISPECIES: sensor histidine kinase [Thalassobaculum]|uniref:histidine kinase n=1 Tax=Thalassobaculum litoreum DSM 18839 TaxID=1123362 RepID=A0A8G2BFU5_9PROT|nr:MULTISPECIES: HAMP domain-containing sensor histidine kinase [Thalassobaculum]SDF43225.1 Signal transduction histidine kinase [Thalassobaculum litoreum DSM 18839]